MYQLPIPCRTPHYSFVRRLPPWLIACSAAVTSPVAAAAQCPDGSPPPCRSAGRAAPAPTSVAVLYFDNLSRDTSDAYLAEGLTEEIIVRLGQVARLQVQSRNAVRRFKGAAAGDPAAAGRILGVAHLLSGTVRRGRDHLRVTVELMRAATGVQVWGNVYEASDSDLMTVEGEIASAVASAVGGKLAPAERQTLRVRPSADPLAYDHFLRADYLLARRTGGDARRALADYEAAVRLDPGFGRAWARIALAYYLFADWAWPYPGLTADSLLARGSAAADRALALDSGNADAWMARGLLLSTTNPATYAGAVPALQRAVRLDPRNAEAWHHLGATYMSLRQDSSALAAFDRALTLDPLRTITLSSAGSTLADQGHWDEARRLYDSAIVSDPSAYYPYVNRGTLRLYLGDRAGAQADADRAVRLRPADYLIDSEALVIALLAAAGDTAGAREHARRLAQSAGEGPLGYLQAGALAWAFFSIGDRDQGFALLQGARRQALSLWWFIRDRTMFGVVRDDPRYQRLLEELQPQ